MAEPLNATFFTLKHRDRAVLLPATLVMAVIIALIVAAWVGLNWRTIALLSEISHQGAQADETQSATIFTGIMGIFASTMLLLFPLFIAAAAYEAACLRWMIRGETPGLFGLTLDHDTWRVWGIYWCWVVTQMAVSMVMSMLMLPIMFMMMGQIVTPGQAPPDPAAAFRMMAAMQAISLLQYLPLIFIGVRLGPAAATSIARRRFSFFEAWSVTADRFWPLLGSWALLWVVLGVVYVILFSATYGVLFGALITQLVTSWPNVPADAVQTMSTRIFSPAGLATIGVAYAGGLVLWVVYKLLGFGINARVALVALEEEKIKPEPPEN